MCFWALGATEIVGDELQVQEIRRLAYGGLCKFPRVFLGQTIVNLDHFVVLLVGPGALLALSTDDEAADWAERPRGGVR